MVIIALKTTFVNLIISGLTCLSELLVLSAMFALRTHRECRSLSKGNRISVPHSKRCRRQLQTCALVFFVALEISLVFGVRPYAALRSVPCTAIDTSLRFRSDAPSAQAEAAAVDCRTLVRGRFTEHNATYSTSSRKIQCGTKALFHFRLNSTSLFSTPLEMQQASVDAEKLVVACASKPVAVDENQCVLISQANNTMYISDVLYRSPPSEFADVDELPFSATNVPYEGTPEQVQFVGERAANVLLEGVREPTMFRHRVFSGFSNETCEERDSDPLHTQVHAAMVGGLIVVWVTCFVIYVVLRCAKPKTSAFFDMRDPLHWAERSIRSSKALLKKDVVVRVVRVDGKERVVVCDADDATHGADYS